MNARIAQTVLLLSALLIGVLNDTFNGLSLLALGFVFLTGYITYKSQPANATAAAAHS